MSHFGRGRAGFVRACFVMGSGIATAVLTACGGGGGGGSPSAFTLSADASDTAPGGSSIRLHAAASGNPVTPTWSLSGPGTLDTASGADVVYTPPAQTPGNEASAATVTATAGGASKQVQITLHEIDGPGHHWDTALAAGVFWRDVVYANGLFVALGQDGVLATSADGLNWTHHDIQDHVALVSAAYSPTAGWVVLGATGQVLSSPDGNTWTQQPALPNGAAGFTNRVVYGDGVFVLAGNAASFVSSDGKTWTAIPAQLHSVAFGNGVFVADAGSGLVSSTDGLHWPASANSGTPYYATGGVAFGNGVFVATDGVAVTVSPDGVHWAPPASPPGFSGNSVVFVDGRFHLQNSSSSADGQTWRDEPRFGISAGAANGDGSVVVGVQLDYDSPARGASLMTGASTDTWTAVAPGTFGLITVVDCSPSACVALTSQAGVLTSTDRTHWTPGTLPTTPGFAQSFFPTALSHAGPFGAFVMAGSAFTFDAGGASHQSAEFMQSANGTDWTFATPPAVGVDNGNDVSMTWSPQGGFAVGEFGNVMVSSDGGTWATLAAIPGTVGERSVAYGAGRYVTVGFGGIAYASPDGATWTAAPTIAVSGTPIGLVGLVFDGQQFVAVGDHGKVATSPDGLAWTVHDSATTSDLYAIAIASNGEIIAVGDFGATESSVDGVHWTSRATLTTRTLRTVSAVGTGFIAAGDDNFIEVSSR